MEKDIPTSSDKCNGPTSNDEDDEAEEDDAGEGESLTGK